MPPLTVKQLGKKGRFANQLFQYAMLRQKARDANTDYCCPPWVGQQLFGLNDPPMVRGAVDIGYKFPMDSAWYDKELFRELFQPTLEVARDIGVPITHDMADRPMVGIHLRRGDYGTFRRKNARWAFVAPTEWYIEWLTNNYQRLNKPIVFIASDEPDKVVKDFWTFDVCCRPFGPVAFPDYADFYLLTQCDVVLASNSSFSFAASMLNEQAKEFWRPRLSEKSLIRYDPWASPIVFTDERYA